LDCPPRHLILRKLPDKSLSWNIHAIILVEAEKVLDCLLLKLAVYVGQPAPCKRLKVIAGCPLEILSLVLRVHIKLLIVEAHEVQLILSQVICGEPFEAKSLLLKLFSDRFTSQVGLQEVQFGRYLSKHISFELQENYLNLKFNQLQIVSYNCLG